MQPHVVVVGSFVQDLTWKCAAFPTAGETVVGTFVTGPGGKGSNQAVAAGRAGARTLFVGAVGRDAERSDGQNVQYAPRDRFVMHLPFALGWRAPWRRWRSRRP